MKAAILKYIEEWKKKGYSGGIPDAVPLRIQQLNKAPSYKAICIAILKNDVSLKYLGLSAKKSLLYDQLKYEELKNREHYAIQLRLFY